MEDKTLIKEMFEDNKKVEEIQNNEEIQEVKKEEVNNEQEKKVTHKAFLILVICGCLILLILIFSTIFALLNMKNTKIMAGIKIESIDVSGLTKEEAKQKLNIIYNEKLQKDIIAEYNDYQTTISPSVLDTNYNVEQAVEHAYKIGREDNIFVNNYNILFALCGKKNINVDVSIDEEDTNKLIETMNAELPEAMKKVNYYIEDSNLIITKGKKGNIIDSEKFKQSIKEKLEDIKTIECYIELPVKNQSPDNIDIDKIYTEVHKDVQDAYYTTNPFTIYPEIEGIDFNIEEAKKILEEDKQEYIIPLTITKPKVTTAQIGSEAFPDLIAYYTTKYDASDVNRSTNLKLACQKLNEKVVLPGEIFSYNKTLGERTVAAGYKNAKVYENGQVVDGIGGGICQISSTLYNAVLMSNMEILERKNHQFVTSYTPAGRDATVVYGLTDFKFKNTRTHAIKIKASASNGIATISIYGIKEEKEYKISIEPRIISTIPYTVKYIEDSSLNLGTEKVKQKGANGCITETYIVKSLNGVIVSKELISKDTYNAMQRIILKGTKGSVTNEAKTKDEVKTTTEQQSNEDTKNIINSTQNNSISNSIDKVEKDILSNTDEN